MPAGLSDTDRDDRSSRVAPRSASSRWICWLSAGWLMCSRAAARPKCNSSATATNASNSRNSMVIPQSVGMASR